MDTSTSGNDKQKPTDVKDGEFPFYAEDTAVVPEEPTPEERPDLLNHAKIPQGEGSRLNSDMVDGIHAYVTPTPNALVPLDADGLLPTSVIPPTAPTTTYYYAIFECAPTAGTTFFVNLNAGTTSGGTLFFLGGTLFPANATVIFHASLNYSDEPGSHTGGSTPQINVSTPSQNFTANSTVTIVCQNNTVTGYRAGGTVLFIGKV